MSNFLTEDQVNEFREAFSLFDKDGNGSISEKELKLAMKSIGQNASDIEIQEMVLEADLDGDGEIDFNEFLSLMARKMKDTDEEEELLQAFGIFDRNEDGYITADDLRQLMNFWGEKITDKEAEEMLNRADEDEDGKLNYEEFRKIFLVM